MARHDALLHAVRISHGKGLLHRQVPADRVERLAIPAQSLPAHRAADGGRRLLHDVVAVAASARDAAGRRRGWHCSVSPSGGARRACGTFWSLSTEWQFYLLVPLLFAVAVRFFGLYRPASNARLAIATVLILGAGTYVRYYQWSHHGGAVGWVAYVYPNLFCNLDMFLLGFLANWWLPHLAPVRFSAPRSWPLILIAIYLVYTYVSYRATEDFDPNWYAFFGIFLPGSDRALRRARSRRMRTVEPTREAARHGRAAGPRPCFLDRALTYPVYLIHWPIFAQRHRPDFRTRRSRPSGSSGRSS